jgi:hypothetical protein
MRLVCSLLVLLVLVLPAAAGAKVPPDRSALLSAATPSFAWDGQQAQAAAPQQSANGFDPNLCTKEQDYYCDLTLVRLDAKEGTTAALEFAIFDFSFAYSDFDLSIFKSNAAGEATTDDFIANGGNLSAAGMEEVVKVPEAEPGYYLATVSYYFSPGANYKGTVKGTGITPVPAPPAPPAPVTSPAAAVTPPLGLSVPRSLGSARKASRKKSLAIRATASEDISSLTLALRDARGKVVASGRAAAFAAGTRALKLKVAKKLRRGRYTLVAIGVAGGARRTVTRPVTLGA